MYGIKCLIPYKVGSATAQTPQDLLFSTSSGFEVFINDDYRVCPQQRSPIVIDLQLLLLHLGERDRTRPSVLTYPFFLSYMRSFGNHVFLSLRPFVFILSFCPQFPKIKDL